MQNYHVGAMLTNYRHLAKLEPAIWNMEIGVRLLESHVRLCYHLHLGQEGGMIRDPCFDLNI